MTHIVVYVALLEEGVDVWRPAPATAIAGGTYVLGGAVPDGEHWQFEPGTVVKCIPHIFEDGAHGLIAIEKLPAQPVAQADA